MTGDRGSSKSTAGRREGADREDGANVPTGSAEARLRSLGLELITPGPPPGPIVRAKRSGPWLFLSGQGPAALGSNPTSGKVGGDVSLEGGQEAARIVTLGLLGSIRQALGSLDRVTSVVKMTAFVNCAPGFDKLSQVSNGASELLVEVFGEAVGKHARSAVGAAELPNGYPVEIELIVEVAG
jgi:enamine deaminase RidA (YjgF/YER057c/UK114 family)